MDIINSSLSGRVYIPSSPPPLPEYHGIEAFEPGLRREFERFLEDDNNRKIFTQAKRMYYKRWIESPNSKPIGNTITAQNQDRNLRNRTLNSFMLEEGQLYKQPGMFNRIWLEKRYIIYYSDAYNIIIYTYRQLLYTGK